MISFSRLFRRIIRNVLKWVDFIEQTKGSEENSGLDIMYCSVKFCYSVNDVDMYYIIMDENSKNNNLYKLHKRKETIDKIIKM